MSLKILILEDNDWRTKAFKEFLGTHDLTCVETASAAIAALQSNTFDLILLDHDLGGLTYVGEADKNTGSEVVRWMVENMTAFPPIIVHSHNHDAALSMKIKLGQAGANCERIPFGTLIGLLNNPDFISVL